MRDIHLGKRAQQILGAVVEEHVATGQPVGARTISRRDPVGLSPASIRNTMADLEEMGLLEQPHASAGRVPSELGYRLYVRSLMRGCPIPADDERLIQQTLARPVSEMSELFAQASGVLSRVSHQIGVVIAPNVAHLRLRHIEFVRLAPRRIVAVIVAGTGAIHNKVFEAEEDHTQEQLDKAGRFLTDTFQGFTLPETREKILAMMGEEKALYDRLMRDALSLGRASMEIPEISAAGQQVFVNGASNLLAAPEFADVERLRAIFRTFEEKHHLVRLLNRCIEEGGTGVQILIGSETMVPDLQGCTVVTSAYGPGGAPQGALGVIGPTRMEYAKAIALVDYVSRFFGSLLVQ